MPEENLLLKFFDEELVPMMREQIVSDQARWGDTWRYRPVEGQEERMFTRFRDYFDQYKHAGVPIPFLKIIGECNIGLARVKHPEWSKVDEGD